MVPRTERHAWRIWWPFGLLCVLGGSRWMLSEAFPESSSTLTTEALGCVSVAALCILLSPAILRQTCHGEQLGRCALAGALTIAGPLLGLFWPGTISGASVGMALAVTPVVLGVIDAATRHTSGALPGRLWPGLAAIAGLLLVLAEPSLASPRADLLLGLTPLITAGGAALFCSARESTRRLPVALLGAALLLGVAAVLNAFLAKGQVWPEMRGLAAGLDALQAFLAVLTLGRVSAARWSAQFTVVPLIVLLEGLAVLHADVPARVITGLVLLAAASVALLLPPVEESSFDLRIPQTQTRRSD